MKILRYALATLVWSFWMAFNHRKVRKAAERIIRRHDGRRFDPETIECQVRIYNIQLDIEDGTFHTILGRFS